MNILSLGLKTPRTISFGKEKIKIIKPTLTFYMYTYMYMSKVHTSSIYNKCKHFMEIELCIINLSL